MSMTDIMLKRLPADTQRWVKTMLALDPKLEDQFKRDFFRKITALAEKDGAVVEEILKEETVRTKSFCDRLKIETATQKSNYDAEKS